MEFLNKFFSTRKTHRAEPSMSDLSKTSEMLDEKKFWGIIDNSLVRTKNQERQQKNLIRDLKELLPKEIIGFRLRTDKLLYDTYTSEMWCAAYIMNGGCSDDGFQYFRNWIISRGKKVFDKAINNPDDLINEVKGGDEFYDFEDFWYVANDAFMGKLGRELYDYIDYGKFKFHEGKYPKIQFNWEEDDEGSMQKNCPKLFEKLW